MSPSHFTLKKASASNDRHATFQKRLGIGLTVAGVAALCAGAFVFKQTYAFYAGGKRAAGEIVALDRTQFGTNVTVHPVFSFADSVGASHVIRSRSGYPLKSWTLSQRHEIGDRVEILYSMSDPENARLNEFFPIWGWTMLFGGGGVIFVGCGVTLWYWARRWKMELAGERGSL